MDLIEINSKQTNRHPWELSRFDFVVKKILSSVTQINPVIVDIGCGDAHFVRMLKTKIPQGQFYAIDTAFSETNLEMLNNEGSGIYYFNDFKKFESQVNDKIDLVLLLDVIEHIDNDLDFLKMLNASKNINSDTYIFITVPAYNSLFSQHDIFLKHFRRYTTQTLNKVINNAGFKSIDSGYFFFTLLFPRMLSVFREKLTTKIVLQEGLGAWRFGKQITLLTKGILGMDIYIGQYVSKFGITLPGLSTYTICKKPV